MKNTAEKSAIDVEWVELIKQAKILGMTADEVRLFLRKAGSKENA
ncbi:anti-repressor SinI family protein [Virgibacillus sp. NKC19-16]|nr:anti-repressor SinI family protein [Virgibacillus sp. NKC19-16]UJL45358.1 anti-repressor SinI family protein [Virgibacillus sp. NKC19-16]